jgi:peptide/nickel transport system permease protein
MLRTLGLRVVRLLATVFAVSFLTFFMTSLLPGDPIDTIIPPGIGVRDEVRVAEIREELGLNDPFFIRYGNWIGDVVRGDFGTSYVTDQPVLSEITARLPVTAELAIVAVFMSVFLAIPLGIASAYKQGKAVDNSISAVVQFLLSVPPFVVGIFLIWGIALKAGVLPATGWTRLTESLSGNIKSVILPASALALSQLAVFTRLVRADMISTLQENYVLSARAKGLTDRYVLFRHAFRPSSLSLITVVGLNIGALLGGTVVIEQLFAVPGLGRKLLEAINTRDLIVVQGIVLFISAIYVIINTAVDLIYMVVDPRIRIKSA